MTLKKVIMSIVVLAAVGASVASAAWYKIGGVYVWRSIGWEDQLKCSGINGNRVSEATDKKLFVITRAEAICRNHGGQIPQSHVSLDDVSFTDETEFTDQLQSGKANTCTVDGEANVDFLANFFDCHTDNWYVDVSTILVQSFSVVTVLEYVDNKGETHIQYESTEECYELPPGYDAAHHPEKGTEFVQVPCL